MVKEATARRYAESNQILAGDVGARIRKSRQERGLSLAKLGGDDLSRSFLSAVETGHSRISLRALQIVASRLGKPMSYFLSENAFIADATSELLLDQVELAVRESRLEDAQRLLNGIEVPESLRGRALWLQGWIAVNLGRAFEGIPALTDGAAMMETAGDQRQLVIVLYTLATAFYQSHLYDEARQTYSRALNLVIDHFDDPSLQGRITVCLGHVYYVKEQFTQAIAHYDRARQLLEPINDLDNLAGIYSGLSRISEQRQDFANALRYSRMSLGIHELKQNRREAARELNNMASCMRDLDRLDQALEDSERAVMWAREAQSPDIEAIAHSTRAAIYLRQGNLEQAQREVEAVDALTGDEVNLARINAWTVRARVAGENRDYETCDRYFQQVLTALAEAGHHAEHSEAALAYSLLLEERGDTQAALKYALQAARQRVAQP